MVANRLGAQFSGRNDEADQIELAAHLRMCARASDDELADAIAECAEQGLEVSLDMVVECVPDLHKRSIPLDAAIEAAANALQARGQSADEAFRSLSQSYPNFSRAINAAKLLSNAMKSTNSLAMQLADTRPLALPCHLGPTLPDGEKRYMLHQLLGLGSQGAVYLAVDRALSEPSHPAYVAVKRRFPSPGVTSSAWNRGDEATKARRVVHANVVRTLDRFIGADGAAYIVQEYVRGGSLDAWRRTLGGAVPVQRAAELVVQIARGVQAAHSAELIHRDIKPSNILLADNGAAKVADFGIAASELSGRPTERLGSLGFIAPEQYRLETVTTAADVYSLGGVLYWLLTDRNPNGQTPEEAAAQLNRRDEKQGPRPSEIRTDIDRDLDAICQRACAPDRAVRYASADALANDLELWLRRDIIAWNRPPAKWRLQQAVRRSPAAAAIVGAAMVGVVFGVVWCTRALGQAELARMDAARLRAEQKAEFNAEMSSRATAFAETINVVFDPSSMNHVGANWITAVMVLESVMGPNLFAPGVDKTLVWSKRITVARNTVEQLYEQGRQDQFECLAWESSLCLWLLRQGDGGEAKRRLDSIIARWRHRMVADDPWMVLLDVCRDCGEIFTLESTPDSRDSKRQVLARLESNLAKLPRIPLGLKDILTRCREIGGDEK